ncbi:MAG TPA: HEAT repeat domain-containing protein, partial [Pyrinomonadaceae bacterium]
RGLAAADDADTVLDVPRRETGLSAAPDDASGISIIPKAIQLRLESDDSHERAQSVLALARLNTDEAFTQICAAFDDRAEEVREAAARALYEVSEDRAESFTRALREASPERRRNIGAALASSGLADDAVSQLTGESRDRTYDAFSLLFLMAKAGETAPLIRAIESHPDSEVRLAVVKLLALSGQQEVLPSFRRLAVRGSLPTDVRAAVMEAIYQISSSGTAKTPAGTKP